MAVRTILDELFLLAQDIDKSDSSNTARVAAAMVHRRRVLSWAINDRKTHPFQAQFGKNGDAIFWHAETRAIHSVLQRHPASILKKCQLIVCRARYTDDRATDWQWGLARPCAGCERAIHKFSIPTIIYSLDVTGEWATIDRA